MNHITQPCCASILNPCRPGIVYLLPRIPSAFNRQIEWLFGSLTPWLTQRCSNSLKRAWRTTFNIELQLFQLQTSRPVSTCDGISLACLLFLFLSSIISSSYSDVSWADQLILQRFWILSQCFEVERLAPIGTNIYGWDSINSILSISTFINISIILFPTILDFSTLFRTFQSLYVYWFTVAHI